MTARKKTAKPSPKRGTIAKPAAKVSTAVGHSSPHREQILIQAAEAAKHAESARHSMEFAVKAALTCGSLLGKERQWFDRTIGRKHKGKDGRMLPAQPWDSYFDAHYSKTLPPEAADRFVRLARRHEVQGELHFGTPGGDNAIRSGILALELFPPKAHEPIPGDAKMPKVAAHLTAINRLAAWFRDLTDRTPPPKLPDSVLTQLAADLAPVGQMIETIRSEIETRRRFRDSVERDGARPHPR